MLQAQRQQLGDVVAVLAGRRHRQRDATAVDDQVGIRPVSCGDNTPADPCAVRLRTWVGGSPHAPVGRTSEDSRSGYQACKRAPWWTISASAIDRRLLTQTPRAENLIAANCAWVPDTQVGDRPPGRTNLLLRFVPGLLVSRGYGLLPPPPCRQAPQPVASSCGK